MNIEKKLLAPGKSCDRLRSVRGICLSDYRHLMGISVRKAEDLVGEVSRNGPGSSDRHLVDHASQHLFLRREDVVVAGGGLCSRPGYRPSFHNNFHTYGYCLRSGPIVARRARVDVS